MNDDLRYLVGEFDRQHDFRFVDRGILIARTGSWSYNTHTETSDVDFVGITVPSLRHHIGLGTFEGWEPKKGFFRDDLDFKVYSLHKTVRLLLNGNPNILELLWLEPHLYEWLSPAGASLRHYRMLFSSKRAYRAFAGYAAAQFKKMTAGKEQNYMGRERREWVAKIGYDPKDASHLIRLLIQGKELAATHRLTPWLTGANRDIVLGIKQGQWSLDAVKELANALHEEAEQAYRTTTLPDEPDTAWAEHLLIEMQRYHLGEAFDAVAQPA